MNPFVRMSMLTLVIQPSFRALGQMQVKWQTFEKLENKRQMYGSQAWVDPLPYICLLFSGFSNACHFAAFWPTDLKLGCITNFDILSLVMGLISLVNEIQFMLISSRHISNRSIPLYSLVFLYSPVFPCVPVYSLYSPVFPCIPLFPCIPVWSTCSASIQQERGIVTSRFFSISKQTNCNEETGTKTKNWTDVSHAARHQSLSRTCTNFLCRCVALV